MASPELGATLLAMEQDLALHMAHPEEILDDPSNYMDIASGSAESSNYLNILFSDALVMASDDPRPGPRPRFELTRRMLGVRALLQHAWAPADGIPINLACVEAELRFARSLAWHTSGQQPQPDHMSAAVYFDIEGCPFAYQKSSG